MSPTGSGPRTHYDVLEVSRAASPEVLRAAYRSLIQRFHPDRNPGDADAAEKATLVINAYQVLSDPAARAAYDLELEQQADRLRGPIIRGHRQPVSVSLRGKGRGHQWLVWAPTIVLALFLWLFWTVLLDTPPAGIETRVAASPRDTPQRKDSHDDAARAARTVPVFIENTRVALVARSPAEDVKPEDATHVLSIPGIGLVAGGVEPERYIALVKSSQDYIARKLSERLTEASYDQLIGKDGDRYLKRLILDSIADITNTQRSERDAPADNLPATHYGAVEILLPDAFSVESRQGTQVTIQRRNAQP